MSRVATHLEGLAHGVHSLRRMKRCLKYMAHPTASEGAAAPMRKGRHRARNSSPLKAAPPAPIPASAIGMTQHEEANSPPNPTVVPSPASQLTEATGASV